MAAQHGAKRVPTIARNQRPFSAKSADENRRLKKMFAEMSMQAELLKEALGKK